MEKTEFDIRTYSNGMLHVTIGKIYGAEGSCGVTNDQDVQGKLVAISENNDTATIWSNHYNWPCEVKLRSLYELQKGTHE